MITRTSQPASGAMLISEMKEFASFPKATQRYIRRSLDVAYSRRDPLECWARDEGEGASIRAQGRLYKQLDHLRLQVPDEPPRGDPRMASRIASGDEDRQLEQLTERRSSQLAERRLGHDEVAALARPLEDRPRMTTRGHCAFPGPAASRP